MSETTVIATRPTPGRPRPYEFPAFERSVLSNGLALIVAPMPGRPLISASLLLRNGAADDAPAIAGATSLASRALSEGTERYDAVALVEATERLGAGLHADAGWDAATVSVEVPVARLEPALGLLAEMAAHPTFPAREVDRLREERLNDLLQARAEPRRRVDEAFIGTIYQSSSPYHQPSGGLAGTVETLDPGRLAEAWRRGFDPARMTLILAGDLDGAGGGGPLAIAEALLGGWTAAPGATAVGGPVSSDWPSICSRSSSSTDPARSRPRSGSATSACPGGSRPTPP